MAEALGIIETCGLIGAIEACDAALKAARVTLQRKERPGGALVTVLVRGETAAVQAAVEAGVAAASKVCPRVRSHVIPRPDAELEPMIESLGGPRGHGRGRRRRRS